MRHQSGGYIWMLSRGIAVRDPSGKAIRMAGSQTDITEGKISDPLTQIPNRLYFVDRLESAVETAGQEDALFAVLFVDIDQFKQVNDSLGHAAMSCSSMLPDGCAPASAPVHAQADRGGPSWLASAETSSRSFWTRSSTRPIPRLSQRILERLSEPFHLEGRRMFVSASMGNALSNAGASPEDPPQQRRYCHV